MTKQMKASVLVTGLYFPEGARWHADRLWFGEIEAARVSSLDAAGTVAVEAQFTTPCAGIGFLPDGSLLVSLMQARELARVRAGHVECHANLASFGCDHINDTVSDAAGRTYVDCLSYRMRWFEETTVENGTVLHRFQNTARESPMTLTDQLVMVDVDGSARTVADGLLGPNGLAITESGRLIVAEWRANRLTSFRILDDGSLEDRRLFGETEDLPDGICADAEGAVWCASPQTGDCVRMLEGGRVSARVVPAHGTRVTSCVLGGPGRRTLYLTTDRHPQVGGGAIEAVNVDVPGAGFP